MSKVNVNAVDPKLVASAKAVMGGDMGEWDILETRILDGAEDAAGVIVKALSRDKAARALNQVQAVTGIALFLGRGLRVQVEECPSMTEEAMLALAIAIIRHGMDA